MSKFLPVFDDDDDDNDALAVLHPFQQSIISGYCKGDCKDPVPVKSCRFGFSENYSFCENWTSESLMQNIKAKAVKDNSWANKQLLIKSLSYFIKNRHQNLIREAAVILIG